MKRMTVLVRSSGAGNHSKLGGLKIKIYFAIPAGFSENSLSLLQRTSPARGTQGLGLKASEGSLPLMPLG